MQCKRCHTTNSTAWKHERPWWMDAVLCDECMRRAAMLDEAEARIKRWAARDGTRRRTAAYLVRCADQVEHRESFRAHHRRWAALWDFCADPHALRKILDRRLAFYWIRTASFISDPDVPRGAAPIQPRSATLAVGAPS